jgi:peptide/nickel transport system ATP-binding protein
VLVTGAERVAIDVEAVAAEPPPDAFLSVRDLQVQFPTEDGIVQAVNGINLDLARGQTLGIVGESGSGKSVTSQAILGLLKGTSAQVTGEISLDGQDLVRASEADMRKLRGDVMSMIFQDPLSSIESATRSARPTWCTTTWVRRLRARRP